MGRRKSTLKDFENRFIIGDCEEVMKTMPEKSIDLVLTSPPYADQRDYGRTESSIDPNDYVKWFIPKAKQIYKLLKDDGSFVLNINDKVVDGFQHLYVFELVVALCNQVGFHLVRDYIWYNPATPPNVYSRGGYGIMSLKIAGKPLFSGFPAFLVTNLLLVQCSIAVLLYFCECKPVPLFPSIYAP